MKRVTCALSTDVHDENARGFACVNPKGVALVPYRGPKDIREGDLVRFTKLYPAGIDYSSGSVHEIGAVEVDDPFPFESTEGHLFTRYEIERLA